MAYADEGFYENDYYGNAVPGDLLYRYLEAASDRIDNITYNRLQAAESRQKHQKMNGLK